MNKEDKQYLEILKKIRDQILSISTYEDYSICDGLCVNFIYAISKTKYIENIKTLRQRFTNDLPIPNYSFDGDQISTGGYCFGYEGNTAKDFYAPRLEWLNAKIKELEKSRKSWFRFSFTK